MKLNKQQVTQYLKRLDIHQQLTNDLPSLKLLQEAHLKHVTYENIDILNKQPLSLNVEDLFEKIVINKRGGYCFETNTLYAALLRSLGFNVTSYTGRYVPADKGLQMRRHRILNVEIDDVEYISDVGVRVELPRQALQLVLDKVQTDGYSNYKFSYDDFFGYILWQQPPNKKWKKVYGFTREIQNEIDYIMPSFYCELHPTSPFINTLYIALFTDEEHLTLTNNVYSIYKNGEIVHRETLRSKKQILELINDTFNLAVNDVNLTNLKIDPMIK